MKNCYIGNEFKRRGNEFRFLKILLQFILIVIGIRFTDNLYCGTIHIVWFVLLIVAAKTRKTGSVLIVSERNFCNKIN